MFTKRGFGCFLSLVLIAVVLSGCETAPLVRDKDGNLPGQVIWPDINFAAFKSAEVYVSVSPHLMGTADTKEQIEWLRNGLIEAMTEEQLFETTQEAISEKKVSGIRIAINIDNVTRGEMVTRTMYIRGFAVPLAHANNSVVNYTIKFYNNKTKKLLGKVEDSVSGGFYSMDYGGQSYADTIKYIINNIVEYIKAMKKESDLNKRIDVSK